MEIKFANNDVSWEERNISDFTLSQAMRLFQKFKPMLPRFAEVQKIVLLNTNALGKLEKESRERFYTKGELETKMEIVEKNLREKFEDMQREMEEQFHEKINQKADSSQIKAVLPYKASNKQVTHEIAEVKSKMNILESYIQSIVKGNKQSFERDLAGKADMDYVALLDQKKPDFTVFDELSQRVNRLEAVVYRDKTPISVHDLDDGGIENQPANMVDLEDRDEEDFVQEIGSHRPQMEGENSSHLAPTPGGENRSIAGSVMRSGARDPRSNRRVTLLQFEETVTQINMNIAAESERISIIETNILDIKDAIGEIRAFMQRQDELNLDVGESMKFFRKKAGDFDRVDKRISKDLVQKPIAYTNEAVANIEKELRHIREHHKKDGEGKLRRIIQMETTLNGIHSAHSLISKTYNEKLGEVVKELERVRNVKSGEENTFLQFKEYIEDMQNHLNSNLQRMNEEFDNFKTPIFEEVERLKHENNAFARELERYSKRDREIEVKATKQLPRTTHPSPLVLPRIGHQYQQGIVTPARGRVPSVGKTESVLKSEANIRSIQLDRGVLRQNQSAIYRTLGNQHSKHHSLTINPSNLSYDTEITKDFALPDLRIPSVDLNSLKIRLNDQSVKHLDTVLLTDIKQLGFEPPKAAPRLEEEDSKAPPKKKRLIIESSSHMLNIDSSEVNIGEKSSVRMSSVPTEIKLKKFTNM